MLIATLWQRRGCCVKGARRKTESAFGSYFCLLDDPAQALLALADVSADELSEVVIQAKIARRNLPMRLSTILAPS